MTRRPREPKPPQARRRAERAAHSARLRRARACLAARFPDFFLRWFAPDPRELGVIGEALAARHLARQGLRVFARRLATPFGELDLVMRRDALLVVAEVKSARSFPAPRPRGATPIQDLRWRPGLRLSRRQLLRQGRALTWLCRYAPWAQAARLDLVEVFIGPPHRVIHAEGISQHRPTALRWRECRADEGTGAPVAPDR